jgi:hypothetical protein
MSVRIVVAGRSFLLFTAAPGTKACDAEGGAVRPSEGSGSEDEIGGC